VKRTVMQRMLVEVLQFVFVFNTARFTCRHIITRPLIEIHSVCKILCICKLCILSIFQLRFSSSLT